MTRTSKGNLEEQLDNPESLIREARRIKRQLIEMAAQQPPPLDSYIQPQNIPLSNAIRLPEDERYELKPAVLTLVTQRLQFGGLPSENPIEHLSEFTSLCEAFKGNNSAEITMLTLFPYTLRDRAKRWLLQLEAGSITTWDQLSKAFMAEYYPAAKILDIRKAISSFFQLHDETVVEAWERLKDMIRSCPNHGLHEPLILQQFYGGMSELGKQVLDGLNPQGGFNGMNQIDAKNALERLSRTNKTWRSSTRVKTQKQFVNAANTSLEEQIESLRTQLDALQGKNVQQVYQVCEFCQGPHSGGECASSGIIAMPDEVEFADVANTAPMGNSYNPNWKNHPNFGWRNHGGTYQRNLQNGPYPQQQNLVLQPSRSFKPPQDPMQEVKDMIKGLVVSNNQMAEEHRKSQELNNENMKQVDERMRKTDDRLRQTENLARNTHASLQTLERQVGQLTNQLAERTQGTLPSNTEQNPIRECKTLTLRSGKTLNPPIPKDSNPTTFVQEKEESSMSSTKVKDINEEVAKEPKDSIKVHQPSIPYPSRLKQNKERDQFEKFYKTFSQVHVNLPLLDVVSEMPKYAKFLKDIISNKRKLDMDRVVLNEGCSAILSNKLPMKQKDPGCFTLPCTIGNITNMHALADLGASINLMPSNLFDKLGLHKLKETRMCIQLADRTVKIPRGIVEDILVKIDKFVFPADFVVMDMSGESSIPLILGRPFLATSKALIDVSSGQIILRVNNEDVTFNLHNTLKHPAELDDLCLYVDFNDELVEESITEILTDDLYLTNVCESTNFRDEIDNSQGFEQIGTQELQHEKTSFEDPPELELKALPKHLCYDFLDEGKKLPVIISSDLTEEQRRLTMEVLKRYKRAFAFKISDITGISPTFCSHKILMEKEFKPCIQPQRRLNPNMCDVVKKEVIKLLDAGLIYPISDSEWVSPVQIVPKKGGITVVKNDNNELIPTRVVTGHRVCIDYRKLNSATRKDHFPLPFIDQMLERLSGHMFYCFLDGFSGYFQIPISPEDQHKTTFTCPFGTFAYRRMSFGLCNAPATFQRCMIAIFSDMIEKCMEVFIDDLTIFGLPLIHVYLIWKPFCAGVR